MLWSCSFRSSLLGGIALLTASTAGTYRRCLAASSTCTRLQQCAVCPPERPCLPLLTWHCHATSTNHQWSSAPRLLVPVL
eukprot:scaffold106114_cov69-Phaeocystis_antarctica.AAC.3